MHLLQTDGAIDLISVSWAGHLFSNWLQWRSCTCHAHITPHQQCCGDAAGLQVQCADKLVTHHVGRCHSSHTLGRLGRVGGLAVGPLGRPAASPGFTLLGRSSLDTPDPGRSKARSPAFMNPRGLFLIAFSAAPFTSGVLLPALLLALLAASETCKLWLGIRHLLV